MREGRREGGGEGEGAGAGPETEASGRAQTLPHDARTRKRSSSCPRSTFQGTLNNTLTPDTLHLGIFTTHLHLEGKLNADHELEHSRRERQVEMTLIQQPLAHKASHELEMRQHLCC